MNNQDKKESVSMIADLGLFCLGMFVMFLYIGICVGIIVFFAITGEREDVIGSSCVFAPIAVLTLAASMLALPRWYTRITLGPENVLVKTALRKPVDHPYKYYQYVYKASYWHGSPIGLGITKYYIVFSHGRMKDEQLYRINQVASSEKMIKIRYSPQTYQKLMKILPSEMQYKLKVCRFE